MLLPETFLQGMKLTVLGEALDGGDVGAVGLDRQDRAGLHRQPVHMNGARTALAGVAPDVGPREPQHVPQIVDEEQPGLYLAGVLGPVDGYGDAGHPVIPPPWL